MPQLELIWGNRIIPFPAERFEIGSGASCAVRIEGRGVQPKHVEVLREHDGTWWVRDIAGSGSVRVDGNRTWESQLVGGTFLRVGEVDLSVRESGSDGSGTMMKTSGARPLRRDDALPTAPAGDAVPPSVVVAKTLARRAARSRGQLEAGDLIENRYRIVKRIAAGGMGEVYEAEHVELHKPVAVKVMLADLSKDADFVARFKREAVASSRIGQHNIVDISDFGRTGDGRFFFVMELLDGLTLAAHLREDGAFAQLRAASVAIQIGRALMAAHDRGIVHRDLKPENVMLLQRPGQPDFVKVLDFGIAKVSEAHPGGGGLTQVGTVVGTPQYMSPEQAAGLPVDARTDIYSLGLIFYELLTGRPTFAGDSPSQLMSMQMTAAPPPLAPGPVEPPVAPELEQLVFHLLQKKPGDRPATMHDVVERLEPFTHRERATGPKPVADSGPHSVMMPLPSAPLPRGGTRPEADAVAPRPAPPDTTPPMSGPFPPGAERARESLEAAAMPSRAVTEPMDGPPVSRPRAREGQGKRIALLFLASFLAAGLAGVLGAAYLNAREPVEQPAAPERGEKGQLTVDSVPPGAEVYRDAVRVGTAPVTLVGARGEVVDLRFELQGHRSISRRFRIEATERRHTVELEREKTGPR
ncbi:MAG: protein kinase [Archangiaceae bacterium]|nr:protein kinase [Archangiaceae bacterium]